MKIGKEKKTTNKETKNGKPGKFLLILKLFKQNFISLHRLIWGRGWKRFGIAIAISLVLLTALLIFTIEVTSQPRFCNSCHIMEPYYASWKESSHKHVTCTDCHFPPGIESKIKGKFTALAMVVNYFTGVYKKSKPWAEIPDESCMRTGCHETRLLQGKVKFKKNILFDHGPHLGKLRRGRKLRCTSCHSQIVQGSHMTVTENTCFLCHFKHTEEEVALRACTKCHEPPIAKEKGDTLIKYDHTMVMERKIVCQKCHGEMVVGDGSVPKMRCNVCHADIEKIKLYDNTQLIHKNHITDHKIECDQCHTELQHKSVARTELVKPDCHACHPDFHNAQLYLFTGTGGKGIPNHPSPMYESGLNCQACHIYHQSADNFAAKGEITRASGKSCEPCHGKGYNRLLAQWKNQADRKIAQLSKVVATAEQVLETKKNENGYSLARQKIDDAVFNTNLVKFGNSIHNIAFANQLMDKAYQFAEESLQAVHSSHKLPPFEKEAHVVPGECSNCHSGVELLEPTIFGWKYSHAIHLKQPGLTCQRCHSHKQKHGQLIIQKQDCMNCHHKELAEAKVPECKNCHTIQQSVYYSHVPFSTLKIPNVMADDLKCIDCHQDEKKQLLRPGKSVCSKCHEKEYEDMFDEWQNTSVTLLNQLKRKVKQLNLRRGDPAYDTLVLLESDGSKGIHNPELYEKLIEEALK
jgi:nitrate/TMAO reductase-like tetraheme cytochrome c subunit